jgi:hypothetical protein
VINIKERKKERKEKKDKKKERGKEEIFVVGYGKEIFYK